MLYSKWIEGVAMRVFNKLIFILLILLSVACHAKQEGTVQGTIVPPGKPAQVSAIRDGNTIVTVHAEAQDGKFRLGLAAGTYTISVSSPSTSFPIHLDGVVVKPGETTTLPPLQLETNAGKAVLIGRIIPPHPDSEIKLLSGKRTGICAY